jgi:eukaryotic-like serine/threonine-protein kinase
MVAKASCGDPRRLRGLLDDRLPADDQARLTAHLENCEDCRRALEELAAGGRWWDDLRSFARDDPPGAGPAGPQSAGTSGDATADDVDFLEPAGAEDAGALGRFGPYVVLEVLGRGGMGVVLKALDPSLHRVVAIKVLAPQLAASANARRRFTREARAAASVSHDHVVSIHAVDEVRGLPFLVMPCIAGRSLQDRIHRGGPLETREVLRIGMQVAQGLAAAHAQGLIHRDIKPANILLENGVERVKITDFGLARAVDDASLTQSGVVAGTPEYMAPEQARGEPVDARSDLFSLGSVLYAMTTGHPPFRARTVMAVLRRVSDEEARPIRAVNPEAPAWLEAIVARLHAKDPAARFSTAAEVADVLGRHLAELQHPAPRPGGARHGPDPGTGRRPRRTALPLAVALALLLLPIAGLLAAGAAGVAPVSGLLATVLRIRTPAGTLAVEVDDPAVEVLVDGAGDEIVIKGAGLHEVRVRPGLHRLKATRGGRTFRSEELAIQRDGRTLVRIRREADPGSGPGRAEAPRAEGGRPTAPTPAPLPTPTPTSPDLPTLAPSRSLADLGTEVWSLAYSPDGRRLIWGGASPNLAVCEPPDGPPHIIHAGEGGTPSLAFSPDGRAIARGGGDGSVRLWDADSKRELATHQWQDRRVYGLAFSPDGKTLAAGAYDGSIKVWDLGTGRERPAPPAQPLPIGALQYTPDGRTLVASTGDWVEYNKSGEVTFWDAATAAPRGVMWGFRCRVASLAIAPDGRTVLAGSFQARLWDLASASDVGRLTYDDWQFNCVAYSPDGRTLASGHNRGDVVLWDVAARRPSLVLKGHRGVVGCVAFSPDGRTVAAGGWDSTLLCWDLSRRPAGAAPSPPADNPGPGDVR